MYNENKGLFFSVFTCSAEAKHASRVGGDEQQQQLKSSGSDENNDNHPLPSHGSAPSSIHSVSTHDASDNSFSDESHASLSILESIGGRTRDRVLATDVKTDCETYGLDHRPPVENVADGNVLADLGLDCLDETIQSLLDTKTPMLPLRFRSNIDGRQVGGGRTMLDSGSTVNRTLTSDIDTDATPILVRKTGELANRNSRAENVNRSQDGVQKPSRLAAPSTVADAAVNADSRLPQPDASEGPRTLESLADLDNLIARYRNIRSVNTDSKPGHSSSSFDQNSNLKNPPVPATGALPEDGLQNPVDNVEKRETLQHSRVDGQQTKRASLDFAATLNLSAECGLDNDDFEDIRPNLLNISTDDEFSASATPHVLQRGL
jgi:hypothetical protein